MADRDEKGYAQTVTKEDKNLVEKSSDLFVNDLKKINGIGDETAEDILRMFTSKQELIEALKTDKVSLRNDVVKKLKKHFKIKEGD